MNELGMNDITIVLFLIGILVAGSVIMDFEGSMESFKSIKKSIDELVKGINKI